MPGPQILIVEDEFLIRMTLAEALADEGFAVIEASDGDEALQALQAHPAIALLMTDIQLPGALNGTEVARRAREQAPSLPVIFMTGRPDSLDRAAAAPGDVFIAKPYLPSTVCAVARRLTGQ